MSYSFRNNKRQLWTTISLLNLCIVAALGVTLRSKILFPLPGIDFSNTLHAHSHFAFAGWITLALCTLMVYEILPAELSQKKAYHRYLAAIYLSALGMLVSFLAQGYAFFSIVCSTLLIIVTYSFSFVFIRDILKTKTEKAVKTLSVSALICLVLSSAGPFTLAGMMATGSKNNLLYKDAIYTYLHLQYNGFFSLAVFALLLNALHSNFTALQLGKVRAFAQLTCLSVLPSLFISYLWHYNNIFVNSMAGIGIIFVIGSIVYFFIALRSIKDQRFTILPFVRHLGVLSIIAFLLKSFLQTGTIIPSLGRHVYGDRAIIIGYLHLVLLGFVSLYLITHLLYLGILDGTSRFTKIAVIFFATAIIANEVILMVQGFGNMLMISYSIYTWLLWGAAIMLFMGTMLIFISRVRTARQAAIAP